MDKNSNLYTFIYASIMVIVVAAALAFANGALKGKQAENIANDKRVQILSSVRIDASIDNASEMFDKYITKAYCVNSKGEVVISDAKKTFEDIDVSKEVSKPVDERVLPVYEAKIGEDIKYILPVYGAGLWGPIWGYISLNSDKNTIYAASYSHESETPGLGAKISTLKFQDQFKNKQLFKNGVFRSIGVLKANEKPDGQDYVDAISGSTKTSKGLENMLSNSLKAYESFLKKTEE